MALGRMVENELGRVLQAVQSKDFVFSSKYGFRNFQYILEAIGLLLKLSLEGLWTGVRCQMFLY